MRKMKKIGIVGAGPIAKEHIRAFLANADVEVSGIYSRTQMKAQNLADEFGVLLVAGSLNELYEKAKPDLVVVAVSIMSAKDILKECIDYGVPILTEKPIALNLEDSREVQRYAREKGCKVWVGLNRRHYSATRAVLGDLSDNEEPRIIQVWDQQDLEVASRLGHPADVQNNWMYANSIHLVDYLCIFGRGDIKDVEVTNHYKPQKPSLISATVGFSSGDVALYTAIWNAPGPWGCVVTTPSVRWEMLPLEAARSVRRGTRQAMEVPINYADRNYKPGFFFQACEVINALDKASGISACTIDEAIITTELVDRIYSIR